MFMLSGFVFIVLFAFLFVIQLVLTFLILVRQGKSLSSSEKEDEILKEISSYQRLLDDSFEKTRSTITLSAKEGREELDNKFLNFSRLLGENLSNLWTQNQTFSSTLRSEISSALVAFENKFSENVKDLKNSQKEKFDELTEKQNQLTVQTIQALEKMRDIIEVKLANIQAESLASSKEVREAVEKKLIDIQKDNTEKLEKMRETVDEKLHNTLENRLNASFRLVSERLEQVQKGLGEMQSLATGVGDLKKVLSNVKTKGVLGEYQLGAILDELLTPSQYGKNVKTKENSNDIVEYAIKIPSKDDSGKNVWIPLDAKFPTEDYSALIDAYNEGDVEKIEKSKKELERKIKTFAKDINTKYIDPPNTTDFAIMFLPIEGLYAEVLRLQGLFEMVQRDFKVTITGPTTISAFLNSLQMGFRTLAVEKRTSEIWHTLSAVRTEFGKFGAVLENTKKKLDAASKEIDGVGVRTRAIERKLKDVDTLPETEASKLLDFGL
ncbi:MAG: DNA recombination protein RmuC [Treponema sp.]